MPAAGDFHTPYLAFKLTEVRALEISFQMRPIATFLMAYTALQNFLKKVVSKGLPKRRLFGKEPAAKGLSGKNVFREQTCWWPYFHSISPKRDENALFGF